MDRDDFAEYVTLCKKLNRADMIFILDNIDSHSGGCSNTSSDINSSNSSTSSTSSNSSNSSNSNNSSIISSSFSGSSAFMNSINITMLGLEHIPLHFIAPGSIG